MDNIRTHIARHLLSIGAVFLRPDEPFVWASGIKSPIYCDNRLILTAPEARNEVEQAIADTVKREYPEAEVLMGTSGFAFDGTTSVVTSAAGAAALTAGTIPAKAEPARAAVEKNWRRLSMTMVLSSVGLVFGLRRLPGVFRHIPDPAGRAFNRRLPTGRASRATPL